ncbi:MAG: transposase, partial [Phycisphaera sp.]|nr:transposase [Phycisphaera sp.]
MAPNGKDLDMSGVRRRFSKAFKVGAVALVTEQGYTIGEAARRL